MWTIDYEDYSEDTYPDPEKNKYAYKNYVKEAPNPKSRDFSGEDYDDSDYDYWSTHGY